VRSIKGGIVVQTQTGLDTRRKEGVEESGKLSSVGSSVEWDKRWGKSIV
jgi:hypothetical protein